MNKLRRSHSTTLSQRIGMMLMTLVAIIVTATAGSLWFSRVADRNIQSMHRVAEQSARISTLQHTWMSVMGTLDTFSVTRPTDQAKNELDRKLQALDDQLNEIVAAGSFGISADLSAQNQQILEDLNTTFAEVEVLANEIFELSSRSRWGAALQRRQSGMGALQTRLEDDLQTLNTNLQTDLNLHSADVERSQQIARWFSVLAVFISVGFALAMARVGRRRVTQPLNALAGQVDRIRRGDLSEVEPLQQKDELGDLSQAVAMMAERLREAAVIQEQRVKERTRLLEQRSAQVQAAAQVARDISTARDLAQMLDNAVDLVRDRLGFYHAGIFLTDVRNEFQVLRAATGEAGRKMLEQQHSLRIGQTGLVGFAAHSGEARVAANVAQDAAHFRNPLLPETASEAALPLKTGGRVIGVLDVQSRRPDAFDPESLNVLQLMADQLAIAIQNARLVDEIQKNLAETQSAFSQLEQEAWLRFFQSNTNPGYSFDGIEILPLETVRPEDSGNQPVAVPLRVRGENIGTLEVWPRSEGLSDAERSLLETVAGRLSQIMENARLYEETQSRAAREETINRLTATIARSLDLDGVLRSATLELGKLPAVREAAVVLDSPVDTGSLGNGGGNGNRP